MRALGVDVGAGPKWLDVVVLEGDGCPVATERRVEPGALAGLVERWRPDVVAIDSPPSWARSGGSRRAERDLLRLGIHAFPVPSEPRAGGRFFEWMGVGFLAFEAAARAGYPRYRWGPVRGTAVEVFPHASAVALAGQLPPRGAHLRRWRAAVLERSGVAVDGLASADQVDAALAALTGIRALQGRFTPVGEPEEGVVVLPEAPLAGPFRRPAVG
ncbi:MAG TPA: DUF429 domain-containing protein [Actinomycetota bacterium]|nr:DUF429 domain-containing protein [Actinomycetota bacterium]